MADEQSLQDLERLTQEIINRFEDALSKSTTSELSSVVDGINKSLEKQVSLVQNISSTSSDRLKNLSAESKTVSQTTADVEKQTKLYNDILSINDDISENWNTIIKQSAMVGKNYDDINKKQKKYLVSLNASVKKEQKITDLTLKRIKSVNINQKKGGKKANTKGGVPQFVNPDGLASTQIGIESLTGGKPYFASHPELGVPMGLFNTKDEPNKGARVRAIQKYGTGGSISGVFPQYADDFDPNSLMGVRSEASLKLAGALVAAEKILKNIPGTDFVMEMTDMANKFADKLQEFTSVADESVRSAAKSAGLLMTNKWGDMFNGETPLTRVAQFQDDLQKAVQELNIDEKVLATYENLAELQKSFTEYSKTNVLLRKDDLKNLIYLKHIFGMTESDLGEIQGSFTDLGLSSEEMIKYTTNLYNDSREVGVSTSKLLKETAKLMKLGMTYRFKGGVKDMEKMQVYAASAKFDIEKAYGVMDKSMTIEGATELASQLQVLGGAFSDISGLDLFAKAQMGDVKGIADEIVGRMSRETGMMGGFDKDGMFKFTVQGRQLLRAFQKIDGFSLGENLEDVIVRASKEAEIRKKIINSTNQSQFLSLGQDTQKKVLENLAKGSFSTVDQMLAKPINFATQVLDANAAVNKLGPEQAVGGQSIKTQEELNKQIIATQSQSREAFDDVKVGLESLKRELSIAGNAVMDIGIDVFKTDYFKKIQVITDYLGLQVDQAILINKMLGSGEFASGVKGLLEIVKYPAKFSEFMTGLVSDKNNTPTQTAQYSPGNGMMREHGGIIKAAGGMVMGPSHMAGGVKGSGMFNNVEVEGGEAIINKKSTQMFSPVLSKLNEIGGGKAFSEDINSGKQDSILNTENKTINIRIDGKLEYNTGATMGKINVVELAKEIQELTDGTTYDGAY